MNIADYIKQLNSQRNLQNATEHTYRPTLQVLLEKNLRDVSVTNEPKRGDYGAPDYVLTRKQIPLGHIETKDIGTALNEKTDQLQRYRKTFGNLLFTDYLRFRLYRDGDQAFEIVIGEVRDGRIKPQPENFDDFRGLLKFFASYTGATITTANDLAQHMALKARMLATEIVGALSQDKSKSGANGLHGQLRAFRKYLIRDIDEKSFADIYAQTVAYGMFAARLHDTTPQTFTRQKAASLIPASNPFLRKFFQHIAGSDLDARTGLMIDDLTDIFRIADVGELMKIYGQSTQSNDPFIHFYETFLSEYDPKLRKSRGVYYTPKPVVYFIVRAVDEILRGEFDMSGGISDTSKITVPVSKKRGGGQRAKTASQARTQRTSTGCKFSTPQPAPVPS